MAVRRTKMRVEGKNMLKNLKLSHKLTALFMVMAATVAITGGFGAWTINKVGGEVQTTLKAHSAREKLVVLMKVALQECRSHLLESALVRNDRDEFDISKGDYEAKRDRFRGYCEIIQKGNPKLGIPPAPPGSQLEERVKAVSAGIDSFDQVAEQLLSRKEQLLSGVKAGAMDSAAMAALADDQLYDLSRKNTYEAAEKTAQTVDDLMVTVGALMTQANQDVASMQRSSSIAFGVVIFIAILLAIVLGTMATRNIVSRIRGMESALDRGAEGDLTALVEVTSQDELGKLSSDFNQMVEKLSGMIWKVKKATGELSRVSEKIFDASKRVTEAAEVQATGVSETSSAVIEINASIKEVAGGMESLSLSAAESSSSTLELAASIEEVALNVETLSVSVDEVSASIMEMAASIKQIDRSVASLMEASTTTASSVAQMDSSIHQVGENAAKTAAISETVLKDAETGKSAVEATIAGMAEISRASAITADVVNNLSVKAQDIGAILSVIDEVAEQTNLLALNAAIIAAQAGVHGKGFAVVADEIRELAERTSNSTREITRVIKGVQNETSRAVDAINQAERSIADGQVLSQKSGEALQQIVIGVQKAADQVANIAKATVEQTKGSQMIRQAMDQVSEMVTQIAKATGEQGRGSELIMAAVERMKGLAGQVLNSTREQSKVGSFIARSTENITEMVGQVKRACGEQANGSEQIAHAVENIQFSASINLDAARVMEEAVASLSHEIRVVEKEVGGFRVEEKGDSPVLPAEPGEEAVAVAA